MIECSCVRTSRVLFILPMCKELQPGHVNSYTTFNCFNAGFLCLVLLKKHNFVVFFFIGMSTFGSTRHLRSCVVRSPTNGMVSQIVESWLLWGVSSVVWSGVLFRAFIVKQSISKFAIRLGRPSNDKNFLISLTSVSILLGVQIRCTRSISALTQEVFCRQGTKLTKLEYYP